MTTGKKIALLIVLALAAVTGVQKYKDMQLDKPNLVGRCFVDKREPTAALMVMNSEVVQDSEGKDHNIYGAVLTDGQMVMPLPPLVVRKLNEKIASDVNAGRMIEVNCETGQPITK